MGNLGDPNNDISFDVLSRLPTKYMPRLKCVSKGWNRLISDPIFMKVQSQKREPLSGFFFQQKYEWCNDDITTISYIHVEKQDVDLHQTVFNFLPEPVVLLASCNGLVCCRSCSPFEDPCIYICNPLNNNWIKLKWDAPNKENSFALAFDPCRDLIGTSTMFKLIRVKQFETDINALCFSFEVYSSDSGAWKKSEETCKCNNNLHKNKGIFAGGVLHWLTDGDEVLTFHVENELSWLVSVPLPSNEFRSIPEACIGDSDGRLHYILVSQYGFQVWFLEDYFESRWSLKLSKTLEEMEEQHSQFLYNLRERVTQRLEVNMEPWVDPLAFKDGYLLMRVSRKIMLYNIETNKMQIVCFVSKLGTSSIFGTVLPYSLSLVPLNQA
ncbi:F-box protein At5g07610-like [Durio zibethinus]|uniref:F-box protein At5g07610-like n=1 Tax=Durio zibethinus TaxID=66656 RepID=A0A6P5XV13_DURZI|nr:F-box protein At5g07610-like [Durio zibethinus]